MTAGLLRCASCGEVAVVVDRSPRPRPWCLAHSYGHESVDPTVQINLTNDEREALHRRAFAIPLERPRAKKDENDGD